MDSAPGPALPLFSYEWKRHRGATDNLALHLRFDLAGEGRTVEAIELIRRILRYPRLSRAIFNSPVCGRLPYALVHYRTGVDDEELREILLAIQGCMAGYGQFHVELAMYMLGDPDAMERAGAILERCGAGEGRTKLKSTDARPPSDQDAESEARRDA
jgi:hypothetical protein